MKIQQNYDDQFGFSAVIEVREVIQALRSLLQRRAHKNTYISFIHLEAFENFVSKKLLQEYERYSWTKRREGPSSTYTLASKFMKPIRQLCSL